MFQGFTRKVLAMVLLQGLIACAVVYTTYLQLSEASVHVRGSVAQLQQLGSAAAQFSSDVTIHAARARSPGAGRPPDATVVDPPNGIGADYAELLRLSGATPMEDRVRALGKAMDRWHQTAANTEAARSGAEPPNLQALLLLGQEAAEIGQVAQNLALERLAEAKSAQNADVLRLGGLLVLVSVVSGLMILWSGRGFAQRALALPGRFETMVYGEQPAQPVNGAAARADPVEQIADQFWLLAQKLRMRLSENEKIERMAFTDPLTGLPNRRGLLSFLDALADGHTGDEEDGKIGLVHIDLDHFKTINDTLGHDAGDTVLREATKRMSTAIRDSDLLARLGGDEFLVVATGIECEADLTRIADRLLIQFQTPIMYQQRVCHVGISMGLVLGGQRGRVRDPKRLLINADMALFRAKSQGRGQFAIFNSAMADEARRRNERSVSLGKALQDEAFHPWFQPMIDLKHQQVTGLELLARWHDDERGVLMPDDFIEDAEANSLMEEIGLQVLQRAIRALQAWRLSGAVVPVVHLNVSRTQLLSSSFVDRLSWTLDEANLPPGQFAIEVDERDCSERGSEVAFANIRRMRDLGLQIVLDNFGTKQAALNILAPLRARMVKCSPMTFQNVLKAQATSDQVAALSALEQAASAFGISLCAKGVETSEQSDLLRAAGITTQQGDHLASVFNADDTGRFLRGELEEYDRGVRRAS